MGKLTEVQKMFKKLHFIAETIRLPEMECEIIEEMAAPGLSNQHEAFKTAIQLIYDELNTDVRVIHLLDELLIYQGDHLDGRIELCSEDVELVYVPMFGKDFIKSLEETESVHDLARRYRCDCKRQCLSTESCEAREENSSWNY